MVRRRRSRREPETDALITIKKWYGQWPDEVWQEIVERRCASYGEGKQPDENLAAELIQRAKDGERYIKQGNANLAWQTYDALRWRLEQMMERLES
jgi:hypothetical protein